MRQWKVSTARVQCGAALDCWIVPGEPICVLSGEGWSVDRCQQHAPEPAPETIAPSPESGALRIPDFTRVGDQVRDYKALAGKDE